MRIDVSHLNLEKVNNIAAVLETNFPDSEILIKENPRTGQIILKIRAKVRVP